MRSLYLTLRQMAVAVVAASIVVAAVDLTGSKRAVALELVAVFADSLEAGIVVVVVVVVAAAVVAEPVAERFAVVVWEHLIALRIDLC